MGVGGRIYKHAQLKLYQTVQFKHMPVPQLGLLSKRQVHRGKLNKNKTT